jgi:hypothetical protein
MLNAEVNFEFWKFEDKAEERNSELTQPQFSIALFRLSSSLVNSQVRRQDQRAQFRIDPRPNSALPPSALSSSFKNSQFTSAFSIQHSAFHL